MDQSSPTGFRAGLEVHQQLDTGKLFCRCPGILREDTAHFTIRRRLRPSAGESGIIDAAAREAFGKKLVYVYHGYRDTTCLVELDDEPPHAIEKNALSTALTVCLLLESNITNAAAVMRKLVIDGSNPSSFQRTLLLATGGHFQVNQKKIGVQTVVLEEDAARAIEKKGGEIAYRLDRLGIPLIEIATEPDFENPAQLEAGARALGELLRRTCAVKRGLGTIRQDLNVSIQGGTRIELKGVQELNRIAEFATNEVARQQGLLKIREALQKKGLVPKDFATPIEDVSAEFAKNTGKILSGKTVLAMRAPKLKGILKTPLQPDRRFGSELADHARVIGKLGGIIHSDEDLEKYPVHPAEQKALAQKLGLQHDDAFILAAGNFADAQRGLLAVQTRLQRALEGVPPETRNAIETGSSEYLRPIAGSARMYPETDEPLIIIDSGRLAELKTRLPKTVEEREIAYTQHGLSKQLVDKMKLDNFAEFFESLIAENINATTAAVLLLETLPALERTGTPAPPHTDLQTLLRLERDRHIDKKAFSQIIASAHQTGRSIADVAASFKLQALDENAVRQSIRALIDKNHDLVKTKGTGATGALMGDAMKQLGKTVPGATINRLLAEELANAANK